MLYFIIVATERSHINLTSLIFSFIIWVPVTSCDAKVSLSKISTQLLIHTATADSKGNTFASVYKYKLYLNILVTFCAYFTVCCIHIQNLLTTFLTWIILHNLFFLNKWYIVLERSLLLMKVHTIHYCLQHISTHGQLLSL